MKYTTLKDLAAAMVSGEIPMAKRPSPTPKDRPPYPHGGYGFEFDNDTVYFRWWPEDALSEEENDAREEMSHVVFDIKDAAKAAGIDTHTSGQEVFIRLMLHELGIETSTI